MVLIWNNIWNMCKHKDSIRGFATCQYFLDYETSCVDINYFFLEEITSWSLNGDDFHLFLITNKQIQLWWLQKDIGYISNNEVLVSKENIEIDKPLTQMAWLKCLIVLQEGY